MIEGRIYIRRSWLGELPRLLLFVLTTVLSVVLTFSFPQTVIEGTIFHWDEHVFMLKLPLLWLVPATVLLEVLWHMYNYLYIVDSRGIEAYKGILSLNQIITMIRLEDIRSVERDQTIWERLLNVGDIEVSTAASSGVEVKLEKIFAPRILQNWLLAERDAAQKAAEFRADQISPEILDDIFKKGEEAA